MAETFTHICIKPICGKSYTDTDPDAYYCEECKEKNKVIARQVEAKLGGIARKSVKSDLQIYNEALQRRGLKFPHMKDMGI